MKRAGWLVLWITAGCNRGSAPAPQAGSTTSGGASTSASVGGSDATASSTGAGAPPIGPFASGDRLRARYLEAPGGARQFYVFYDTELDTTCRFYEVAPDQYYCLPWSIDGPPRRRLVWQPPDSDLVELDAFLDRECTIPAFYAGDRELGDTILIKNFDAECDLRPPPGTPATLDAEGTVYWNLGWCAAVEAGEPLNATTTGSVSMMSAPEASTFPFVGGRLVHVDGARRLVAEDGAFEVISLLDQDNRPCDIAAFELDQCIPGLALTFPPESGDPPDRPNPEPSCSAALQYQGWFDGCPVTPTHAVGPVEPHFVGTLPDPATLLPDPATLKVRHVVGPCESEGWEAFEVGAEVDPEELTVLQRTRVGDRNLVAEYHLDRMGEPARFIRWWNKATQAACTVERIGSQWRCGSVVLQVVTE